MPWYTIKRKCSCRRCSCQTGPGEWFTNLADHFCWEKSLSAGDASAFVTHRGTCECYSSVLWGGPSTDQSSSRRGWRGCLPFLGCPGPPGRLCLQFCHLLLVWCTSFCSFPPSTQNSHMNQPISISWLFKGKKWCLHGSILQNNTASLHLKNTRIFVE